MTLKLKTRVDPVKAQDFETPVDLDGTLTNEDGTEAFATAGLVAALSALSVAEAGALDFSNIQAVIPTADGTGTGVITAKGVLNICTVTPTNAAHIATLPAPVPGTIVILLNAAANTAYELMTNAPTTVLLSEASGGAAVESLIPAKSVAVLVCRNATNWVGWTIAATTLAALAAAD